MTNRRSFFLWLAGAAAMPTSAALALNTHVAGAVRIGDGLHTSAPTGGDSGSGTINATAVYDRGIDLNDVVRDVLAREAT